MGGVVRCKSKEVLGFSSYAVRYCIYRTFYHLTTSGP